MGVSEPSDYSILKLISSRPAASKIAVLICVILIEAIVLFAPTSDFSLLALAILIFAIAAFITFCFVEIVCLLASTLLPR